MTTDQSTLIVLRHAAEIDAVSDDVTKVRPSTLLALLDETEALRADAARYRWLRSQVRGKRDGRGRSEFDMPDPHPLGNIMQGSVAQHFDSSIDAEIAAAPVPEAGG